MVAQLFRLRLRLFGNSFLRGPWQVVGLVLSLMYGLFITGVAVLSLVAARFLDPSVIAPWIVAIGSIVVLGFLLVPLFFGVDDAMDPRKFSLFGIPSGRLSAGIALSAIISVPSVMIILVASATVITWTRSVGTVIVAIICAVLLVATCVLGARVTTAAGGLLLASRQAREWTGVIGLLALILISPLFVILFSVDWGVDGARTAQQIATVLGWTPFGAVFSAPAAVAEGASLQAIAQLAIAAAFVLVLWLTWDFLVSRLLVTPERQSHGKEYAGLGAFDRLPHTPTGGVAARSLTYWARDPRYRISLLVVPIVPLLLLAPLYVAGVPTQYLLLLPVPFICLFLGWSLHNDVAYDHTAFWLHLASGVSGRADRLGRIVPVLMWGIPAVIIGSVLVGWLYGDWSVVYSQIGVSWTLLAAGLGISSVLSAAFPYAAARPSESPFQQPQGAGATGALIQSVSFFASLLLAIPAIIFGIIGLMVGGDWALWSLAIGFLLGTGTLVAGILFGGRIFDARGPEILKFALSF